MNTRALYDGITDIPDEMIEEAGAHRFRKSRPWIKFAAAAAAVAVAVGVGGVVSGRIQTPFSGAGAGGGGTAGPENGYSYMSYVGPVLPLTAVSGAEGVTAERSVDFDFSPYKTRTETYGEGEDIHSYETWDSAAIVTDAYTLRNETDEDKTLSLLYPAILSFRDAADCLPTVTVDGREAETALHIGAYTGGYRGVSGADDPDGSANLDPIRSWEGYRALLSDDGYRRSAMEPLPELTVPVTVYRVDGYEVAPTDAVNPSLKMSFRVDPETTRVMSWGANALSNDAATGQYSRLVGGLDNLYRQPEPMYVILYGGDIIGDYSLQGYKNAGGDPGTEIDVTATVTRYETTLDELLRQLVDEQMSDERIYPEGERDALMFAVPRETLYGLAAQFLLEYGLMSDAPKDRYAFGHLEHVFEAFSLQRVLYLAFDVTVPAGGSTDITAVMRRDGSRDYIGPKMYSEGYDLATRLGSMLLFAEQRASVSHTEEIEMVENSFGFDIDSGLTAVTLDPAVEHYWMQVAKKG